MEQVVLVQATAQVSFLVHGTEAIQEQEVFDDVRTAMYRSASEFIVCGRRTPAELPPWFATVHRLDISLDRFRTVYTDVTDDPTE